MTSENYKTILQNAIVRMGDLNQKKDEIEAEITRLNDFIGATIPMLSEEDREVFGRALVQVWSKRQKQTAGLTDAIRDVLMESPKKWFSVTDMRNALKLRGFDFSDYKSNPLASISATLKRLVPTEVECAEINDVAGYRWKNTKANKERVANRRRAALQGLYGGLLEDVQPDAYIDTEKVAQERAKGNE